MPLCVHLTSVRLAAAAVAATMPAAKKSAPVKFRPGTGRAWNIPPNERPALVRRWTNEALEGPHGLVEQLTRALKYYREARAALQALRDEIAVRVYKRTDVVGLTTSGAAKHLAMLASLGAKVVICEEAAEVLEAHLLASLSRETCHVILIGDHLQLRPKLERHELTCEAGHGYRLDLSLFERLVTDQRLRVAALTTQWRMRPEIADLPRATLYPHLRDAPTVSAHPAVRGVRSNLWFFDHSRAQDRADGGNDNAHSHTHAWECEMVVRFLLYLQHQGYASKQIAVLTPYLGQLARLRAELTKQRIEVDINERDEEELDAAEEAAAPAAAEAVATVSARPSPTIRSLRELVRLATVDNFQGEEADVVVISLVRSNPMNKIGFLKIPNRVNVLLTRARHGMFLFGNLNCLVAARGKANPWPTIAALLRKGGRVASYLPLQCPLHAERRTDVREPTDFSRVAEGGCTLPCGGKLACGHACPLPCHPLDTQHRSRAHCKERCARVASLCATKSHACAKLCSDECTPCAVPIRVTLSCGHQGDVPCHRSATPLDPALSARCRQPVVTRVDACGHTVTRPCSEARQAPPTCDQPCGRKLLCGHDCVRPCHDRSLRLPRTGRVGSATSRDCRAPRAGPAADPPRRGRNRWPLQGGRGRASPYRNC